ncbi:uncharacterized protein LOC134776767 [Penaeus indicus]|uniref:uncharacterized protein LOC134776767 n=1 Tax=Penaeus indicus TaxID=29960 RepID=UPI00300C77D5
MHLGRVCLVLLLVTEATDWAEGVARGVAKSVKQTPIKTKQEEKRHEKDKRQQYGWRPRPCCGSVVPQHEATELPREFYRVIAGPSVKIENVPSKASAPPPAVTDLSVTSLALLADGRYALGLAWTAPGGFLGGTASYYIFRLSDDQRDLTQSGFDEAAAYTLLHAKGEDLESVLRRSGSPVALNVTFSGELDCDRDYFVALKAIDDEGTAGHVSNLAHFTSSEMRFPALFDRVICDQKTLTEEMSNHTRRQKTYKKKKIRKRRKKNKRKLRKMEKNMRKMIERLRNRRRKRKQTNKKRKNRKRRKKTEQKITESSEKQNK